MWIGQVAIQSVFVNSIMYNKPNSFNGCVLKAMLDFLLLFNEYLFKGWLMILSPKYRKKVFEDHEKTSSNIVISDWVGMGIFMFLELLFLFYFFQEDLLAK